MKDMKNSIFTLIVTYPGYFSTWPDQAQCKQGECYNFGNSPYFSLLGFVANLTLIENLQVFVKEQQSDARQFVFEKAMGQITFNYGKVLTEEHNNIFDCAKNKVFFSTGFSNLTKLSEEYRVDRFSKVGILFCYKVGNKMSPYGDVQYELKDRPSAQVGIGISFDKKCKNIIFSLWVDGYPSRQRAFMYAPEYNIERDWLCYGRDVKKISKGCGE